MTNHVNDNEVRLDRCKGLAFFFEQDKSQATGKVADVALLFEDGAGLLAGAKLVGFAVWQRRQGPGFNVTFPSRTYSVNGDRRSYALLRARGDNAGVNSIRDAIIEAYQLWYAEHHPTT